MTLNNYSEMKGYKCDTVQKVKKNGFISSVLAKQSQMERSYADITD